METWYFTFLSDDFTKGDYVQPIRAKSFGEARSKMFELYGEKWCFQYSEEQWEDWNRRRPHGFPIERELELIIVE